MPPVAEAPLPICLKRHYPGGRRNYDNECNGRFAIEQTFQGRCHDPFKRRIHDRVRRPLFFLSMHFETLQKF
jgi:hypothetical protein